MRQRSQSDGTAPVLQPADPMPAGSTTPSHTPSAAVCSTAAASAKRPAGRWYPTVMASTVTAITAATASGPPMIRKYRYSPSGLVSCVHSRAS